MTLKYHYKLDRMTVESYSTTPRLAWVFKVVFPINTDMFHRSLLALSVFVARLGCIVAAPTASGPTVTLDSGTFQGVTDGVTNKFLGIPFAKPPYVHTVPSSLSQVSGFLTHSSKYWRFALPSSRSQ